MGPKTTCILQFNHKEIYGTSVYSTASIDINSPLPEAMLFKSSLSSGPTEEDRGVLKRLQQQQHNLLILSNAIFSLFTSSASSGLLLFMESLANALSSKARNRFRTWQRNITSYLSRSSHFIYSVCVSFVLRYPLYN